MPSVFSGKSLVRKYIVLHLFQNLGHIRKALFAREGSGIEQRGGPAEDTCSFTRQEERERTLTGMKRQRQHLHQNQGFHSRNPGMPGEANTHFSITRISKADLK